MANGLTIGLTGGIGSGKSEVSDRFARLGIPIIDADLIAHQLVEPGTPALAELESRFGAWLLRPDGALDRAALREHVFGNPAARGLLEDTLHPRVRREILAALGRQRSDYCIVCVPLMVEARFTDLVDRLLVVDVPEDLQIQRTTARSSLDAGQVRAIMGAQVSRQERLEAADDVLDNSGDLEELSNQVAALHEYYTQLAKGDLPAAGE